MLRNILINHKDDGYSVNDLSFNIQAFADDVVIISNSINGLRRMINSVDNFCNACGMKLTASKCQWLSYTFHERRRVSSSEKLSLNGEEISSINLSDSIKYLGAPIATNRETKMQFTRKYLTRIKHEINQIMLSKLSLSQITDAIKRLIIPKLDLFF